MATVTGLTAERMIEMENATIISGHIDGTDLILVTRDATEINAGAVQGPIGPAGASFIVCTSTTRPSLSAGEAGKAIYETDTKLIRVWTGTLWRLQERVICTSTTRPAMGAGDEGVKIYETDTNYEYVWTGSAWFWLPVFPAGIVVPTLSLTADPGWSMADGTTLSRTAEGARLFAKIGTLWGPGNGSSTFNKPDLRGKVIVGQGGAIAGALGAIGGEATHVLTVPEMPAHTHSIFNAFREIGSGSLDATVSIGATKSFVGDSVAGGNAAHNNLQPYMLLGAQISL